jgi:ParB-like chromosome segregation protein Spo0J
MELPPPDTETYAALKASIQVHGVLVPLLQRPDGTLLDGHHRQRACEELGITDVPMVTVDPAATDEHVNIMVNALRRSLTPAQRRELVAYGHRAGRSVREIAEELSISKTTVGRDLAISTVPCGTVEEVPRSRRYAAEVKRAAVARVERGEALTDVATDMAVPNNTMSTWVKQATGMTSRELHKAPEPAPDPDVIPADPEHTRQLMYRKHHLKPDRIYESLAHALDGLVMAMSAIGPPDISPAVVAQWDAPIADALKSLRAFHNAVRKHHQQQELSHAAS